MHSLSITGFGEWHTAFQPSASGQIETTAFFGHNMILLTPALIIVSSCRAVFFGLVINWLPESRRSFRNLWSKASCKTCYFPAEQYQRGRPFPNPVNINRENQHYGGAGA